VDANAADQVGDVELKHGSLRKRGSVSMDIPVDLPEIRSFTECIKIVG
jgi:hypothetical protein